jgi:hypothetical protein
MGSHITTKLFIVFSNSVQVQTKGSYILLLVHISLCFMCRMSYEMSVHFKYMGIK